MSVGPGKYDSICDEALFRVNADGVILIVLNGIFGSGFSVSAISEEHSKIINRLPDMLRDVANQIEADIKQTKNA